MLWRYLQICAVCLIYFSLTRKRPEGIMDPVTPDNTRVFRIMNDFNQCMRSAGQQGMSASSSRGIAYHRQGIPFNMPEEEQSFTERSQSAVNRVRMAQIEGERASEEQAHKRMKLDLESRNERLFSENSELKRKCDHLQLKVKQVTTQAIDAQDKFQELRNARTNEKEQLEEALLDLQKRKEENESELMQNLEQAQLSKQDLNRQNLEMSMKVNVLRGKLEEATTLLSQKTARVDKLTEDLHDHQSNELLLREYQMKIKDLELRLSRSGEAEEMAKVMKDSLQRLHGLETEVVKLRESNRRYQENESNIELMKEKLLAAETKLIRSEKRVEQAAQIEMENKELIAQLNEAKSKEIQSTGNTEIQAQLSELQQKEALSLHENSQLQGEVESYKKRCELLETTVSNLEQRVSEKNESNSAKDTQIRHLQKRALLLSGERNSLRAILQSYDSELTTTSHADQLIKRVQNAESANEKVHARFEELRKETMETIDSLGQYKLQVKQLESTVLQLNKKIRESAGTGGHEKDAKIEALYKKVEELENERSELQKSKEHLELWMERNRMRGDFDPSNTRVIHFQMNPADLAHKQSKLEVVELREKCARLMDKVRKLEENADLTANITLTSVHDEELKQKLDSSELKNQRLKEVFQKKITEFREACYTLTGFRIDFTADTQLKLLSMYAENERDYLLFKLDPSGEMQLLETEYSKTLKNLIELHLHHQNSIPMFLSSITADLFSQQTTMF